MRTSVFRKFAVLAAAALVLAAGTSAQTAKPDELNTAIRGASDYLNSKIPKGSKIVVLNVQSNSPELSDYIIDELIANAVNDRVFTVVNRKQLDDIRKEQMFQMSGEVDDKDALAIGRFFGAQTIVSGVVSSLGAVYSLRVNALEVQTAQVQGQFNRNIASSQIISSLMGIGGGYSAPITTTLAAASAAPAAANEVSTPLVKGNAVPGSNLTEKLVWLQMGADSHNTYIIEVNADENIASHTLEFPNIINITVALRGLGANRNVRLGSNGTMFTVKPNVTFILENNVTLHGHSQNNSALIVVDGGTFIMNAKTSITGNAGGGERWGGGGGGVDVGRGTFTMNGGSISGNTASSGAGVHVGNGTFTMNGGTVSGNTADNGGGVYVNSGTFTKTGGVIVGNAAKSSGGGVFVNGGAFNMRGGNIAKNTAVTKGGGVCVESHGKFAKTNGIITGYKNDAANGNVVMDGTALPRSGHAVFVSPTIRKETTAGPAVNLSYDRSNYSKPANGAWDQ